MPLPQPQVIDVDMGLGLDTFTDPKRVMPGKFTTLENVRFQRGKRLEMRRGNVAYGGTYKIGNTGSATDSFGIFSDRLQVNRTLPQGDAPLLMGLYQDAAGSRLTGYRWASGFRDIQTAASRVRITQPISPDAPEATICNTLRAIPQTRDQASTLVADSCLVGDRVVTVWSQGTTAQHAVYADIRTVDGELLFGPATLSTAGGWTAGNGWVMAIAVSSTRAWLFDTNNSTNLVRLTIVDVTNPSWTNRRSYSVGSIIVDAVVLGSDVYVVGHNFDGGAGVVIKSAPVSTTTPLIGTFAARNAYAIAGTLYSLCAAKPKAADTKLRVFWRQGTGGVYGVSLTGSTGATVAGPTLIDSSTLQSYQISAAMLGDDTCWIVTTAGKVTLSSDNTTMVHYVRETGAFGAVTDRWVSGMLASKILDRTDTDTASFWVRDWNSAYTESGYFQYQIQNNTMCLSGRILGGRAHAQPILTSTTVHGVPNMFAEDSLTERVLLLDAHDVLADSAASRTPVLGMTVVRANYDKRAVGIGVQTNNSVMLAGGIVGWWDGTQMSHHGVLARPTILSVSTNSAGGSMSNGTYSIIVLPYWNDAQGNEHLGAPSDPFSVVLSGGTSTQRIVSADLGSGRQHFVGTNPSRYLASTFTPPSPSYRYYSTTNGGTLYYRCTDAGGGNLRNCTDTDLQTRDLLPTTGGVVPNAAIDGPPVIGVFNDRVIASSPTDDGILYASKPPSPGYAPELSDELTVSISPAGGPVTAIAENIDKCCVFKASTIQVFTGEGYTASGAGSGYSPAETIHDTIGCPGPWAAVSTKIGVMFDTGGQGIWLLGRDLQVSWIGEAVDSFKDVEVQRALAVPDQDEVRFLLENETTLVYTISTGTWAVFTNTPCGDIGLAGAEPIWLRKSASNLGGVYVESDTVFTDFMNGVIDVSAATMTMTAVMGWLNLAGIQGYMRVWRALFTGDYGDTHTLLIDAGYDYDESTYADSFSLTSANIGVPYDGQVWLRRGYSKAVRLRLRASSSAGDTVGPMSLTGLSFEVGILPRGARMKASKGA